MDRGGAVQAWDGRGGGAGRFGCCGFWGTGAGEAELELGVEEIEHLGLEEGVEGPSAVYDAAAEELGCRTGEDEVDDQGG